MSRFRLIGATMTGEVDGVAVADFPVADGLYYLDSATAAESLRQALDDALEAAFPLRSFSVAWSPSSGKFSFTCTDLVGNWELTFNGELGRIVGYGLDGGFGPIATPSIADNVAQYVIYAGSGRSDWIGTGNDTPNASGHSSAGVDSGVGSDTEIVLASWVHEAERYNAQAAPDFQSGTRDDDDVVDPWTWQDFFRFHKKFHHPFRFYEDATDAVADYVDTYKLHGKSLGVFKPTTREDGSWWWFVVPMEVKRFRAATS